MNNVLLQKQNEYEQIFLTFPVRDYVRSMVGCFTCSGRGCVLCSGHGFRHTAESIAFGRGLNAMAIDSNPYAAFSHLQEFLAWGQGKQCRARQERARIRAEYGLEKEATE